MSDTGERITPGPYSGMLGFELVEAGPDGATMRATPGPEHINGGGIVHGGYLSSLLDSATGWAVHSAIPPGVAAPHTHFSVQFVNPALEGQTLVCVARCLRAGRRAASAEAEITAGDRVIARAVTSHAVLS